MPAGMGFWKQIKIACQHSPAQATPAGSVDKLPFFSAAF
jgi:hypothetical protein